MWHTDFYTRCLQSSTTINDAAGYGVTIEPVTVQPGDVYYKIIGIHPLTGPENGFNHRLYADVRDEQGRRIDRAEITVENFNGSLGRMVIDKPPEEPGTNRPIWPNDRLSAWAGWKENDKPDPLHSDKAHGFHTLHPDEGPLNRTAHHSFYLVFQRTKATGQTPDPDPAPDPEPPAYEPLGRFTVWRYYKNAGWTPAWTGDDLTVAFTKYVDHTAEAGPAGHVYLMVAL